MLVCFQTPGTVRMDRSSGDSPTPPFLWFKVVWAVEIKNVERMNGGRIQDARCWDLLEQLYSVRIKRTTTKELLQSCALQEGLVL